MPFLGSHGCWTPSQGLPWYRQAWSQLGVKILLGQWACSLSIRSVKTGNKTYACVNRCKQGSFKHLRSDLHRAAGPNRHAEAAPGTLQLLVRGPWRGDQLGTDPAAGGLERWRQRSEVRLRAVGAPDPAATAGRGTCGARALRGLGSEG